MVNRPEMANKMITARYRLRCTDCVMNNAPEYKSALKIIHMQDVKYYKYLIENLVGEGENASYQHFLLFPPCFLGGMSFNLGLCVKELIKFVYYNLSHNSDITETT